MTVCKDCGGDHLAHEEDDPDRALLYDLMDEYKNELKEIVARINDTQALSGRDRHTLVMYFLSEATMLLILSKVCLII